MEFPPVMPFTCQVTEEFVRTPRPVANTVAETCSLEFVLSADPPETVTPMLFGTAPLILTFADDDRVGCALDTAVTITAVPCAGIAAGATKTPVPLPSEAIVPSV